MEPVDRKKEFEDIYAGEIDSLFRYSILRVGNRAQAMDIVQDVFVRLWQAFQKGENIENARAFLFAVLKNRIIDWYRKKKSSSLDALLERGEERGERAFEPADDRAHEEILFSAETRAMIEAINSLEAKYRDAVYLRLVEDMPPEEIARRLGATPNTISVRITRGLDKLRKKLGIQKK